MPQVRHLIRAHGMCFIEIIGRVHRQGQGVDAVAAVHRLHIPRVSLRRGEGVARPLVWQSALAHRHRVIAVVGRMHQGIHHIDVVAARGVHHRVAVLARGRDGLAAPQLRHACAHLDGGIRDRLRLVHRQGQRIDAVAAVRRLQAVVIDARGAQLATAPSVWQVVAAHAGRVGEAVGRVHRQGQGVSAVATVHRLETVVIDTRETQALTVPQVRHFIGATDHLLNEFIGRVHRQGQGVDAVAAIHRAQAVVIDARLHEALTMPHIRQLIRAHGMCLTEVVSRVHQEHKTINAITEGDRLVVGVVGASSRQETVAPRVRKLIITHRDGINHQVGRMNGHLDLIEIITALGVGHRVAVETCLRDSQSAPSIRFSLTDIHRF